MRAADIAGALAVRINQLVPELLPGGHREGHEWRAGDVLGSPGLSLGVHLTGQNGGSGHFSTGEGGDALDLIRASLNLDTASAMTWARRWLGMEAGPALMPARSAPKTLQVERRVIVGASRGLRPDRYRELRPKPTWLAVACISTILMAACSGSRHNERARGPAANSSATLPCSPRYLMRAPANNAVSSTSICNRAAATGCGIAKGSVHRPRPWRRRAAVGF